MKKILVVDDEPDILETIGSRLASLGYDVVTALDGQQGFEKFLTERPDLIVLDIKMPVMDGYNFLIAKKEAIAQDMGCQIRR